MATLQLPNYGENVPLGCLYNARTGKYITGPTLWSQETIEKMTQHISYTCQNTSIDSDFSFSAKSKALKIPACLKPGILCNAIQLRGAGKYLTDTNRRITSESLALSYSIQTGLLQLNMGLHVPVENTQLLEHEEATHVVTAIQIGAKAVLVFERERQESEDSSETAESFQEAVLKLKQCLDATSKHDDSDQACNTEHIDCRYYGDFKLESPPVSLNEAFDSVRNFKSENANSQIVVQLVALSQFSGTAANIIPQICDERLNKAGDYWQALNGAISAASTLKTQLESSPWRTQQELLTEMVKLLEDNKIRYTSVLHQILSAEAEAGYVESRISEILSEFNDTCSSPFSSHRLQTWLGNKEKECQMLGIFYSRFKNILTDPLDPELGLTDGVLQFEISLPKSQYIEECKLYLQRDQQRGPATVFEESWIDQTKCSNFKGQLEKVTNFLELNPSTVAELIESAATDNQSPQLQVKCLENSEWVAIEIPSPPEALNSTAKSYTVTISWARVITESVVYNIDLFSTDGKLVQSTTTSDCEIKIAGLDPETQYEAQVSTRVRFGQSQPSERLRFKTGPPQSCAKFVRANWCEETPLKQSKSEAFPGKIFQLRKRLIEGNCSCKEGCICAMSFEVGDNRHCMNQAKLLLLVGETGTGKSTLVNGIANAFYRVRFKDDFRFKLIAGPEGSKAAATSQAHSQTSSVAVYTLFPVNLGGTDDSCQSAMDCPLTIIDTPGFGCTFGGIAADEKIVRKITKVLGADGSETPGVSGIVHAIGFVVNATQSRLTTSQKYIFDQILSLFGKDVVPLLTPILTFGGINDAQVLDALNEHRIPDSVIVRSLKIDNGILYAANSNKPKQSGSSSKIPPQKQVDRNENDWETNEECYSTLFEAILRVDSGTSLESTKEVLKTRRRLELAMKSLRERSDGEMEKLVCLEDDIKLVSSYSLLSCIWQSNFTKMVPKVREVAASSNEVTVLCTRCKTNCHKACNCQGDKSSCIVFDVNGVCSVCSEDCSTEVHSKEAFFYEDYLEKETVTVEMIYARYASALDRPSPDLISRGIFLRIVLDSPFERWRLLRHLAASYEKTFEDFSYNLVTVKKCIEDLESKALRQHPLTVGQHVDDLIQQQEQEKSSGWEDRVKYLRAAKKSARIIEKTRKGLNPLEKTKKEVLDRCRSFFCKRLPYILPIVPMSAAGVWITEFFSKKEDPIQKELEQ